MVSWWLTLMLVLARRSKHESHRHPGEERKVGPLLIPKKRTDNATDPLLMHTLHGETDQQRTEGCLKRIIRVKPQILCAPFSTSPHTSFISEVDLMNRISVHSCGKDAEEEDALFISGLSMSNLDTALDKMPWLLWCTQRTI